MSGTVTEVFGGLPQSPDEAFDRALAEQQRARAAAQVEQLQAEAEAMGPIDKTALNPALVKVPVQYGDMSFTVKRGRVYDAKIMELMSKGDPIGWLRAVLGADQYERFEASTEVVDPDDGEVLRPVLMGDEDSPAYKVIKAINDAVDPTKR